MNLSKATTEILRNFSTINQGIYFKEGNVIRTISVMHNIYAKAVVGDVFLKSFPVYDLPEFLNTVSILDQPTFVFEDKHLVMSSGKNSVKYFYSSPSVVVSPPDKEMILKDPDVQFDLPESLIVQIQKASAIMKLKELRINNNGVAVINAEVPGNEFEMAVDIQTDIKGLRTIVKIEDLKIIPANYHVNIVNGKMINLVSTTPGLTLEYFIAIQS